MVAIFTVPPLPTLDARLPRAPTWQGGRLATIFDKLDTDPAPAPPTRVLVMAAVAPAGPAQGDQVVLRHGHGRRQTGEAGILVGRYPAGFLLRSPTGRCFVNSLDLWSAGAVHERPADASGTQGSLGCSRWPRRNSGRRAWTGRGKRRAARNRNRSAGRRWRRYVGCSVWGRRRQASRQSRQRWRCRVRGVWNDTGPVVAVRRVHVARLDVWNPAFGHGREHQGPLRDSTGTPAPLSDGRAAAGGARLGFLSGERQAAPPEQPTQMRLPPVAGAGWRASQRAHP